MFWGLIMEPQKRYTQTVDKSFHISMAALDLCACTDDPVQVMCGFDERKYLLCTLQKDKILQVPLDINFDIGDEISFISNGSSHVHLTGYLNDDFLTEEDEADLAKQLSISQSNIVSGKRAKKMCSETLQPPAKKSKIMQLLDSVNSQEDDDSDDSDVNLSDILNDEDDDEDESIVQEEVEDEDDDDDDEDGVEEEEDDDDDDDEEDDDDEDDDDDDDDDEEDDEDLKPKMNGNAKEAKKNKVVEAGSKKQKEQAKIQQQQEKKGVKKMEVSPGPKRKIEGGVMIEDIRVGQGKLASKGKTVQVYYEGRLKSNNKMFDSTTKGTGFKFRLGKHEVIKAWEVGVVGMKVGGKRRIVCPPQMAYGQKGSPPVIPPNSTLVFEVELRNVL